MMAFMKVLLLNSVITVVAFLLPSNSYAGGGFGGVSATSTDSSLSISWNWNANTYRAAKSSNFIKICHKKSGSIKRACKNKTSYASSAPKTIQSLKDNQKYKVKVFCYCEKKNSRGKWKKAKWRKVGTLTQSTKQASIDTSKYSGTLSITGSYIATDNTNTASIKTSLSAGNIQGADIIRICYKKTKALNSLKINCKKRDISWDGSGNRLGWYDQTPAMSFEHIFKNLKSATQYKFVAVVFAQGGGGKVVSTAKAHTPKIKSKKQLKPKKTTEKIREIPSK